MTDIIRKKVIEEAEIPASVVAPVVFEKVTERVERFTVEDLDAQIANYQSKIDELKAKKASALALDNK